MISDMKKIVLALVACLFGVMAFAGPVIKFKEEVHDFGTISESDGDVTYEFVFTNTGDAPVVIHHINSSCGCTAAQWSEEPVAPGKTGVIKATYHAKGYPGRFFKTLTVFTNAGEIKLRVKGEVKG